MNKRRSFIKNSSLFTLGCSLTGPLAHAVYPTAMSKPKLSLAQWSLHRALEKKDIRAEDFAAIAQTDYGIAAVEYVNSFYREHGSDETFWQHMKERAGNAGVTSLLIMVDEEGELGHPQARERQLAVENHYKWIHATKLLGGHSIRVNAFGSGRREALREALIESLGQLAEYSAGEGIHVLLENHGLHTSDAGFVVDIIKAVNSPYLGTLPDFGNWCLSTQWGSTQDGQCKEVYDPLKGVAEFLPFAKGVSAKSYAFDESGNETLINYPALLKLVRDSGYNGHIGIEYEGMGLSEPEGIRATKDLLLSLWKELD